MLPTTSTAAARTSASRTDVLAADLAASSSTICRASSGRVHGGEFQYRITTGSEKIR